MAALTLQQRDRITDALTAKHAYTEIDPDQTTTYWMESPAHYPVNPHRPLFYRWLVPSMREEPILKMGMSVYTGITAQTEFDIEAGTSEAGDLILDQLRGWMEHGLIDALCALYYGYGGFEVMFEEGLKGYPVFSELLHRPIDILRPQIHRGCVVGVNFESASSADRPTYLHQPKSFWAVNEPQIDPYFGASHYIGSHIPFLEYAREHGILDMIAIWARKSSVSPVVIEHPSGTQNINGREVRNSQIAALAVERLRANGALIIEKSQAGEAHSFKYEQLPAPPAPDGLFAMADRAEDRMLLGIHTSPELVRSTQTGSYNGKEITLISMLADCQRRAKRLTDQFCKQVIRPLIELEFGQPIPFRITARNLSETLLRRGTPQDQSGQDSNDNSESGASQQPPTPGKNGPQTPTPQSRPQAALPAPS